MNKNIIISEIDGITRDGVNLDQIVNQMEVFDDCGDEKIRIIEDFNFYSYKYNVRTRIDKSCQICIHSSANVYKAQKVEESSKIGIVTVSKYGCPISKEKYLEQLLTLENPLYASPKDFVQSICNIPNAMTTIELGIKGYCNHYVGNAGASLAALWNAYKVLELGQAEKMIVTAFDTLSSKIANKLHENTKEFLSYNEASVSLLLARQKSSSCNRGWKIEAFWFGNAAIDINQVASELNIDMQKEIGCILYYCDFEDYGNSLTNVINNYKHIVRIDKEYFSASIFYYLGIITKMLQRETNIKCKDKELVRNIKENRGVLCVCKSKVNVSAVYLKYISKC